MSNEQNLQDAVAKTAAEAAAWQAKVRGLEIQIADFTQTVTVATKHRESHALAATLGDTVALGAIKKARAEQHDAEQHLADLQIAHPAGLARLAEAEAEAKAARNNLAKFEADILKRRRISLAGKIDDAVAAFAKLLAEYENLGADIVNLEPAPANMHGMTPDNSGLIGLRRIAAALPASMRRLFPGAHHDEMPKMPLMTSESRVWNLPTLALVETKAA